MPAVTRTHIAATWDGSTISLYTDGVLGPSDLDAGAIVETTGTIYLGCGRNNPMAITPPATCDVDFLTARSTRSGSRAWRVRQRGARSTSRR